MKRSAWNALIYIMAGLVVGLNVATMYPHPDYDASWWKIGLCIFMVCGLVVYECRSR